MPTHKNGNKSYSLFVVRVDFQFLDLYKHEIRFFVLDIKKWFTVQHYEKR